MKKSTFEQIYDIVKQIPYGKVATYGEIVQSDMMKKFRNTITGYMKLRGKNSNKINLGGAVYV